MFWFLKGVQRISVPGSGRAAAVISTFPDELSPLEIRGQDLGDVMVLVDSEEEEQEEDAAIEEEEEEEEEGPERDEFPKEIHKHGHIHRVTALVNGNMGQMANGLQALQGKSSVSVWPGPGLGCRQLAREAGFRAEFEFAKMICSRGQE